MLVSRLYQRFANSEFAGQSKFKDELGLNNDIFKPYRKGIFHCPDPFARFSEISSLVLSQSLFGEPGGIRTPNLEVKSLLLCH